MNRLNGRDSKCICHTIHLGVLRVEAFASGATPHGFGNTRNGIGDNFGSLLILHPPHNTIGGSIVGKIAITLVVLLAATLAFLYYQNSRIPRLGVSEGRLKALGPHPNAVSSQTSDSARRVPALAMKDSPAATRSAILAAIRAYGGAEVMLDQPDYLYAVFTTPRMKFRDDVEFYLDHEHGVVHFRSASRAGRSDRGLNRARYEALAKAYAAH